MTMRPEDLRALTDLHTALGEPGSGRRRYAAAMHLNRCGLLSDAALEAYRTCSPRDGEDPHALLATNGLAAEIPTPAPVPADMAIRLLIDEVDRYLALLPGPGIAEVRSLIAGWRDGPVNPPVPRTLPVVTDHLPDALAALRETHPALDAAIARALPHLDWVAYDVYPPDEIGADFASCHAFASLIGSEAPIAATDFDFGLFLIGPDIVYRDHAHPAPELYAPLTGPHAWRFGIDAPVTIKMAHEPVWNEPEVVHMTRTGPVPFLSIFAWTRDVDRPARVVPAADWAALERIAIGG